MYQVRIPDKIPSYWVNLCNKAFENGGLGRYKNGIHTKVLNILQDMNITAYIVDHVYVCMEFKSEADFIIFKLQFS